jgi:hypothetical protein
MKKLFFLGGLIVVDKSSNGTLRYRIEQLEKRYDALDKKMDVLLTNHLPHLKEDVVAVKTRVNVMGAIQTGSLLLVSVLLYLLR